MRMSDSHGRFEAPRGEKAFNAPVPVLLIAGSMPLLYLLQLQLPDQGISMAFAPIDLQYGKLEGLLTMLLVHGGWSHVLMNALGCLIFGTPVARMMGDRKGPLAFLAFYVVCGLVAGLGYSALHWGSVQAVVGASGAVYGLIGAATRLMGGHGVVMALTDRRVLGAAAAWMGINLLIGVMGNMPSLGGARVAWEAHAFGFVFGILAIGPIARVFGVPVMRSR